MKVSEHSQLIKFNFTQTGAKEAEVGRLEQEVEKLSKYCKEVNGVTFKEDATSLCCRLTELKTDVHVPKEDISAWHILKQHTLAGGPIILHHPVPQPQAWVCLAL